MKMHKMPVGILAASCYIVWDEETRDAAVIDPGGEPHKIENFITSNELSVRGILLTHGHVDHIEGTETLRNGYGCDVYGHLDDEEMFENPKLNLSDKFSGHLVSFRADKLIADYEDIKLGSLTFRSIHTPGHTKGGMSFVIDNMCFSGDTLFNASIGRTDLYGGNHDVLVKSITEKLFKLDDSMEVHPGHGPKTTIGREKASNPYVK
jgi:hydroxyacylglutathione hydrolase